MEGVYVFAIEGAYLLTKAVMFWLPRAGMEH